MTELSALAAAVTVEHQTIYGYGVAGAHLAGADRRRALAAFDRHRLRRDQLVAELAKRQETAPLPEPAYALPFAVAGGADARRLCALLEDACAGAAWDLAAASGAGSATRRLAVEWLSDAAGAASAWRATPAIDPALPGRPRG